jgi:GNAT superfamily N-acetyltransferase
VDEVRLRPMRPGDAVAVAHLTTQLGYPVEPSRQEARIRDILDDPTGHAVLVAVDAGDAPIGWVHVMRQRYLEGDATAVVMGLVVDETHRSGGIGERLMLAAEDWARSAGCRRLTVRSRVTRERAHAFYRRLGFAHEKTSHTFRKVLG